MLLQQHLDLIPHTARGTVVYQRPADGYINATVMCHASGKQFKHYNENRTTRDFLDALSSEVGIPTSTLVQSISGGDHRLQGTWVHPQVAIHLAQWCSAEFAVKVSQWVYDWMSGNGAPTKTQLPYHIRRYTANQQNVPIGHFSILSELTLALIAPMEVMGYTLPERMVPDISHGRMFCKWLRDKHGIDTDALPTYWHIYEDGRRVQAKAYPENLLAEWRRHFREEWLPNRAVEYFRGRDNAALEYLPKLLPKPGSKAA
jgi:hypothetical protein